MGSFGLIDDLVWNGVNLGDSLTLLSRHFHLVDDSVSMNVIQDGPVTRVLFSSPNMVPVGESLLTAALAMRVRQYSNGQVRPLHVCSIFPRVASSGEHERIADAPIRFGKLYTELVFNRESLDARNPTANRTVASVIDSFILRARKDVEEEDNEKERIRRLPSILADAALAVRYCLEQGRPTQLHEVAALLKIRPRTLQRWLQRERSSIRKLVDDQRVEFLSRYGAPLSITSAARYLQYSDRRSLRRAQRNNPA